MAFDAKSDPLAWSLYGANDKERKLITSDEADSTTTWRQQATAANSAARASLQGSENPWEQEGVLNTAAQAGRLPGGVAQGAIKAIAAPGIAIENAIPEPVKDLIHLNGRRITDSSPSSTNEVWGQQSTSEPDTGGDPALDTATAPAGRSISGTLSDALHDLKQTASAGNDAELDIATRSQSNPITETAAALNSGVENWTNSFVPTAKPGAAEFVAKVADAAGEAVPAAVSAAATGGASAVLVGTGLSYGIGGANAFSTEMIEGSGDLGRAAIAGVVEAGTEALGGVVSKYATRALPGTAGKVISKLADSPIGEGTEEVVSGLVQGVLTGDGYTPGQALEDFALGAAVGAVLQGGARGISVASNAVKGSFNSSGNPSTGIQDSNAGAQTGSLTPSAQVNGVADLVSTATDTTLETGALPAVVLDAVNLTTEAPAIAAEDFTSHDFWFRGDPVGREMSAEGYGVDFWDGPDADANGEAAAPITPPGPDAGGPSSSSLAFWEDPVSGETLSVATEALEKGAPETAVGVMEREVNADPFDWDSLPLGDETPEVDPFDWDLLPLGDTETEAAPDVQTETAEAITETENDVLAESANIEAAIQPDTVEEQPAAAPPRLSASSSVAPAESKRPETTRVPVTYPNPLLQDEPVSAPDTDIQTGVREQPAPAAQPQPEPWPTPQQQPQPEPEPQPTPQPEPQPLPVPQPEPDRVARALANTEENVASADTRRKRERAQSIWNPLMGQGATGEVYETEAYNRTFSNGFSDGLSSY